MEYWAEHVRDEMLIEVPVYVDAGTEFPDLVEATQVLVDRELEKKNYTSWRLRIEHGRGGPSDYVVDLRLGEANEYSVSEFARDILVTYDIELVAAGRVPELVTSVLVDHVFKQEQRAVEDMAHLPAHVVPFSPKYHVTFSLFSGDGDPLDWDIAAALDKHFAPLRDELAHVANVTVDTQVRYFAQIGSKPPFNNRTQSWLLGEEHLSTFVNSAEWSLTSIHSYPTLHFILYVPSASQRPMAIRGSDTNSFLVPQWGGVKIVNEVPADNRFSEQDLVPIMEGFASQLLRLLGAPRVPKSPAVRLDALKRISAARALAGAAASLGSLHRLSLSLEDIAIPKPVYASVETALEHITAALAALRSGNWNEAVISAGVAQTAAEAAFFDKMMVQQAFFPSEHNIAIYMPLLGPLGIVMFMGSVKLYKESQRIAASKST